MMMNNTINRHKFTIEDIHNIRYENYERTKTMTHKEKIDYTRKEAQYGLELLTRLKKEKDSKFVR